MVFQSSQSLEYAVLFPERDGQREKLLEGILGFVSDISAGYRWHSHSGFALAQVNSSGKVPVKFAGKVVYSDCITDEYFAMYILWKISLEYPDAAIQLRDSHDGQVLLIDASEYLPDWITPETSEDRVWIKNGHLHLIPLTLSVSSLRDALKCLDDTDTLADSALEEKAFERLLEYVLLRMLNCIVPRFEGNEAFKDTLHHTCLNLPIEVAYLLSLQSENDASKLLHLATECYYVEALPAKVKKSVKRDTPFVPVNLTFSRTRYAQLYHSRPPPVFTKILKETGVKSFDKKDEMVEKLIIGFEILASKPALETVYSVEWLAFREYLSKDLGYFGDEREGSQEYKRLMAKARTDFLDSRIDWNEKVSTAFENLVLENFKHLQEPIADDDESWMSVAEDDTTFSKGEPFSNTSTPNAGGIRDEMQGLTNDFENFFNNESGLGGVAFDDESTEDEDLSDSEDDDAPIVFNADKYLSALRELASIGPGTEENDDKNIEEETLQDYMSNLDQEIDQLSSTVRETFADDKDEQGIIDVPSNLIRNVIASSLDQSDTGEFGPFDGILSELAKRRP